MRLKAGVVVAALAAGTTLMYGGPASAQQVGPDCSDFPTQIDIPNSIFPFNLDPTDLDSDNDGVGCEANPGPPVPYNLLLFPLLPPVAIGDEPLDVSPTSGPPGTVITVRGEECIPPQGVTFVEVDMFNETAQQSVAHHVDEEAAGSWSAQLTVPAGVDPDDAFVVIANCFFLGPEDDPILIVRYERVDFDVTEAPTTTTPPAAPAPAPAAPAKPVEAKPTFTG
jgi:hypothetical protein